MRPALLLLVALAGCRVASGPEAEPAPAVDAASVALAEGPAEPEPPAVDTLARTPWGGTQSVDAFRALAASVDTTTGSGVGLLGGTGTFHGGEVDARSGERWQGLYPTPDGPALRSFAITVETAVDPILDDEGGPITGRRVVTPYSTAPDTYGDRYDPIIALVRRPGRPFPDGPLPTAFVGAWAAYEGVSETRAHRLDLALGEEGYRLDVHEGPEVAPGVRRERVLSLSDGATTQPLVHHVDHDAGRLVLLWAGDLDGDGRLDLLLDESWHYNLSLPTLYLSGEAAPGAHVGRVARHETVGC